MGLERETGVEAEVKAGRGSDPGRYLGDEYPVTSYRRPRRCNSPTVNAPMTPLGRFREGWRLKARHAKDFWTPGTEPIETAMEGGFHDGIKFAAEFLEGEGQKEFAGKLRARVQRRV